MGIFDKAKSAVGIGNGDGSDAETIEEQWAEEVETDMSHEDEMMEPEEDDWDDETQEWDSAYRFCEDFLEARGFADMMDFINSCMAYKIDQSPKYRDRLKHGVRTMNQVSAATEELRAIKGEDNNGLNLSERAEELKAANEVINQADKLDGKEEEMVSEAMSIARDLADGLAQNVASGGGGGNVQSSMNHHEEEM